MAANQQGYFFINPFTNLIQLANTLRLPYPQYLSYARAKGLKLHNLRGIYVLVDGMSYLMRNHHGARDAMTFLSVMAPGLVQATCRIEFEDGTEALALTSKWIGNLDNKPEERKSNMKDLHIWHINHPDSGYSSPPIMTPAQVKFSVAYSQALTIGHQNPQILFPRPFFLYGSLRDPVLVASLLSLVMPPLFRTGTIKGYKLMLHGTEPALVFGSKEETVRGVIYVVQSSEDAAKLRLGTKYRAYYCGIQPDDVDLSKPWGTRVNGATFLWEGDKSKVPVGFEQEFAG